MNHDEREEKRQVEEWRFTETPKDFDVSYITEYLLEGFTRCEEPCISKMQSGEDACYCVRQSFPNPETYELYKALKKDSAKIAALTILSKVIPQQ